MKTVKYTGIDYTVTNEKWFSDNSARLEHIFKEIKNYQGNISNDAVSKLFYIVEIDDISKGSTALESGLTLAMFPGKEFCGNCFVIIKNGLNIVLPIDRYRIKILAQVSVYSWSIKVTDMYSKEIMCHGKCDDVW